MSYQFLTWYEISTIVVMHALQRSVFVCLLACVCIYLLVLFGCSEF